MVSIDDQTACGYDGHPVEALDELIAHEVYHFVDPTIEGEVGANAVMKCLRDAHKGIVKK